MTEPTEEEAEQFAQDCEDVGHLIRRRQAATLFREKADEASADAREEVARLRRIGWTCARIAKAADLSVSTVERMWADHRNRQDREAQDAADRLIDSVLREA